MTAISIARNAQAALQVMQWIRNGKLPSAEIQNRLATLAGFGAFVRTKCIFRSVGGLIGTGEVSLIPDSLATRKRWRFPYHSSPYASFIYVRFEVAPQNNGTATDPYCTLAVQATSGTLIGTAFMHAGSAGSGYADVPSNFGGGVTHLVGSAGEFKFVTADTDYTGVFSDVGFARLHSASVWEVAIAPDTDRGYVSNNVAIGAPVLDSDREGVRSMARLLHKRSGNPVLHWCSDLDSIAPSAAAAADTGVLAKTLDPITLSATGTVGGGVLAKTLDPITLSATGTAAYFVVIPLAADPDPPHGASTAMYATVFTNSVVQTNAVFACLVGPRIDNDHTTVNAVSTTDLDGWTQDTAWTISGNYWLAQFSLAVVPGATNSTLEFSVTISSNAHAGTAVTMTTNGSTVNGVPGTGVNPQTDQASSVEASPVNVTVS